MKSVVKELQLY